MVVPISYS
jgi:hypothetical protein